jgi:hypothetical protein
MWIPASAAEIEDAAQRVVSVPFSSDAFPKGRPDLCLRVLRAHDPNGPRSLQPLPDQDGTGSAEGELEQ